MRQQMKLAGILLAMIIGFSAAMADEPPTFTCSQIQQYQGVFEGDRVKVVGVCICESARFGYSITVIADYNYGPWAALMIYDIEQRLVAERGQTVEAVGLVQEYYDKTELNCSDETEFPPITTGTAGLPNALQITCAQGSQEQYESCLIMIPNVEVLTNPDTYGNIAINDGTGEYTLLLRSIDPPPAIGYVYECLYGIDDYHFGEFKIRPRDEDDWVCQGTTPPSPTPTPPSSGTPTPSPTPDDPGCDPSIELFFQGHDPQNCFTGGDTFHPKFRINNDCPNSRSIDLYIGLEVANSWFFWPSWGQALTGVRVSLDPGQVWEDDIIAAFPWPTGVGSFSPLHFYGLMTQPETYFMIGNLGMVEFCYN